MLPTTSVWHRSPDGAWSIYNDGPSLETTCPRWWGPALEHAELATIELTWTGPNTLHVRMSDPHLDWTMTMAAANWLQGVNRVSSVLPDWTWKPSRLVEIREWLASEALDMGEIDLEIETPQGHDAVVMVEEIYEIESSQATLGEDDLGSPTVLSETPYIGQVALPVRPTFMIGAAQGRIIDLAEYEQTRTLTAAR